MPGRFLQWPEWPEYTSDKAEKSDDLVQLKKEIIAEYGEAAIRQGWLKVCEKLEEVTAGLAAQGTAAIPEVPFDDLFRLSEERKQELKGVGCFVVRGVVDSDLAHQWYLDLKTYVADNRASITGWPEPTPFVHNVYFTPSQIAARSHPNQLRVARELNGLWHDSTQTSSPEPLTYADALRIRPPRSALLLGLGPHIDAGSLSRWGDPTYRSVYSAVFSGRPEDLDLYDLGMRQHARQAHYLGPAHSRVLRAFQGWTALTPAGHGDGSLMLYPAVKWAIAYVLLRPFFSPPPSSTDTPDTTKEIMDYTKWTFDPFGPFFPGTFRNHSQNLSDTSHPHLRLKECMVSLPQMQPGDTVWWHADMCHAVEAEHLGNTDACVLYIAATPSTDQNRSYVRTQLQDFLEGKVPEDFRSERNKDRLAREKEFKGYVGEKGIGSEEGRRAMGFGL